MTARFGYRKTAAALAAALAAAGAFSLPVGAASASEKAERIEALVTAYHEQGLFCGSVLVAEREEVILSRGVGLANREWNVPNTPGTRFLIGSAGKQFTAMLALDLAERGQLDLDARVGEYLPDYRADIAGRVTLHQLLTHTSGIPDYFTREFFEEHKHRFYRHDEFVERFLSRDLEFEPGTSARYSSSNYYLLGMIIERVTGEPFGEVLRERLLEPLGMHDSGFDRHAVVEPKMASGYIRNTLGYWTPPFEITESSAFAAGAMYSTVEDLYRFDRALDAGALLSESSMRLVYAPSASVDRMPGMHFAYGGMVGEREVGRSGETRTVHQMAGSSTKGFTSVINRVPDDDHLIVLLANAGPDHFNERLHDLTSEILAILYDAPVETPKPSLASHLGGVIMAHGIDEAIRRYHELAGSGRYATSEADINELGYDLLGAGRPADAVAVFRLNVGAHAGSANAHDSLAEAYARAGERELAIESYERVLSLAPGGRLGDNAQEQLRRLRSKGGS